MGRNEWARLRSTASGANERPPCLGGLERVVTICALRDAKAPIFTEVPLSAVIPATPGSSDVTPDDPAKITRKTLDPGVRRDDASCAP